MKVLVYKMFFIVSKRATRSILPTQKVLVFFSSSFRCCYLTIDLVRSPIIGCEGTGVGRLYSHRRKPMRHFSNFLLGTRSFTKGNIEGHRSFIEGLLLKTSCSRDMTNFRLATSKITLRVRVCKVCLIACI